MSLVIASNYYMMLYLSVKGVGDAAGIMFFKLYLQILLSWTGGIEKTSMQ